MFFPQGPDQDLSACTDQPRVKTRVLQHNRFSQLKEKCSEIITKNVRNKSKPNPTLSMSQRPNSFSHNTGKTNKNCKTGSLPDRRATYNCNRTPKTYELQDVGDIGEGFEIINIGDCLSGDEDVHRRSPQVELLDLSERNSRNRSVESLDSGCDIDTPRANHIDKQVGVFQKLCLDDSDAKNSEEQNFSNATILEEQNLSDATNLEEKMFSESSVIETKVISREISRQDSESGMAISVVCNIQVVSGLPIENQSSLNPELSQQCCEEQENSNPDLPQQNPHETSELNETRTSEEDEDDDLPLRFNEIFKLFEPNTNLDDDVSQYAQHLRTELAWKLASERVLNSTVESVEDSTETSHAKCSDPKKQSKVRSECPVYDDPELDDFIARCLRITCSVQEKLSQLEDNQEAEESLLNCFLPKELYIPDISENDLNTIDSTSMDSLCWSDGEYLDIND